LSENEFCLLCGLRGAEWGVAEVAVESNSLHCSLDGMHHERYLLSILRLNKKMTAGNVW